jgi:hypothetical protein
LHVQSSSAHSISIILSHCGNFTELLSARTKSNATALTLAANRGCLDTVRLLLAQGCCEADWDAAAAVAKGPAAAFFQDVFAHEFRYFFERPQDAAAACRAMFLEDMGEYVSPFPLFPPFYFCVSRDQVRRPRKPRRVFEQQLLHRHKFVLQSLHAAARRSAWPRARGEVFVARLQ